MHIAGRVGIGYGDRHAADNAAGVDVVVEKKCRDACFRVAVDHSPVDGRGAAILRQKGGVEVERTEARAVPHDFGQHSECHHDLQIGLQGVEGGEKGFIFQFLGLQHGQALLQGVLLDGRGLQRVLMPPHRLVRHRDNANYVVAAAYKFVKGGNGEVGRAHIYDAKFFLVHIYIILLKNLL